MKKKVNFYFNDFEAFQTQINDKSKKYGLISKVISKPLYTLEELNLIIEKLLDNDLELEIDVQDNKDNKIININRDYLKRTCKECIHYKSNLGCLNGSSKVRNKHLKTSNSTGCYWGEWKNSGTKT